MTNCEWREKIGLYVDGELEPNQEQAVAGHLQSCADCSSAVLEQQALKKAIRVAGKRFTAPPELYASVHRQMAPKRSAGLWLRVERNRGFSGLAGCYVIRLAVASLRVRRDGCAIDRSACDHAGQRQSVGCDFRRSPHGEAVVSGQTAIYVQSAGTGHRLTLQA